jgi:hypothetical protein
VAQRSIRAKCRKAHKHRSNVEDGAVDLHA